MEDGGALCARVHIVRTKTTTRSKRPNASAHPFDSQKRSLELGGAVHVTFSAAAGAKRKVHVAGRSLLLRHFLSTILAPSVCLSHVPLLDSRQQAGTCRRETARSADITVGSTTWSYGSVHETRSSRHANRTHTNKHSPLTERQRLTGVHRVVPTLRFYARPALPLPTTQGKGRLGCLSLLPASGVRRVMPVTYFELDQSCARISTGERMMEKPVRVI